MAPLQGYFKDDSVQAVAHREVGAGISADKLASAAAYEGVKGFEKFVESSGKPTSQQAANDAVSSSVASALERIVEVTGFKGDLEQAKSSAVKQGLESINGQF